jgi:hypothetical protein
MVEVKLLFPNVNYINNKYKRDKTSHYTLTGKHNTTNVGSLTGALLSRTVKPVKTESGL